MTKIFNQSYLELKSLRLKKVFWQGCCQFGLSLFNGDSCRAGSNFKSNKRHTFHRNKKITKVEVIIGYLEIVIKQMNFYSGQEKLVQVGSLDDKQVKEFGVRVETFEIAADERLIGAELDYIMYYNDNGKYDFMGVTWIKMKVSV